LAEVAELHLDGAEQFAVGGRDEGIDHLIQQWPGGRQQLFAEPLPALVRGFSYFRGV
jgi:hypothetical protein